MNITVYLGASKGNDNTLANAVRELGTWIGESGNSLVYGGSKSGLMGEIAESVLRAGGKVTGVEPQFFIDAGFLYEDVTNLIVTNDMSERKAKMIELGDAFIAFPGGTGTLEEIAEIMSKVSLGHLDAPCILYNLNGYYIQIGGAKDNVALYRQNGNQSKLLASGRELMKGNSSPKLYIKVECDNNGYWTFWTRLESENEYVKEKQIKDTDIQTSRYCGIYCIYTKTRCKGFTFHHIQLSNDVETNTSPDETPDNPDTDLPDNPDTPELPRDVRGMLLFNEIMYNNATDGAEYVEIYNPTEQAVILPALYLYKMHEDGTIYNTTILQNESPSTPLAIPSKTYLCFTKYFNRVVQKHKVGGENIIIIPNFPALNNNGGYLALSSSKETAPGHTFDTCCFRDEMHTIDKITGISLEKKSPELSSLNKNWRSSKHATGGTPGIKNR